jgi:hypothetical protein
MKKDVIYITGEMSLRTKIISAYVQDWLNFENYYFCAVNW